MPNFFFEKQYSGPIVGIDEVGRGSIAGPVVVAAVILDKDDSKWSAIKDSKKLSSIKRELLYKFIIREACYYTAASTVREIEDMNILHATMLAMRRVISKIDHEYQYILVDGNVSPNLSNQDILLINQGDNKSISIAAASIVAKVIRDKIMTQLSYSFPEYQWQDNKGYGTKQHYLMLEKHGLTIHHRKSFLRKYSI